jgi:hypothetical protein
MSCKVECSLKCKRGYVSVPIIASGKCKASYTARTLGSRVIIAVRALLYMCVSLSCFCG